MRVAIDEKPLISGHAVRGIGVHTRELIQEINKLKSKSVNLEVVDFNKTDLSKYDLVHYPYFHPFFSTLSTNHQTRVVVTIHDLIQLIYPKQYPPGLKGRLRFIKQNKLIKQVDGIITISETSKKDIVKLLGVDPKRIRVIYLAPKKINKKLSNKLSYLSKIRKKYNLPKIFIMYVGYVNYNKNIPNLISACKIAKLPLVLIGKQAQSIGNKGVNIMSIQGPRDWVRFLFNKPHPELAHYSKLYSHFVNNSKIIRPGFVPDEDLVAIYNLATVYCQPSFYEGFGLPVLDAMACGAPVVISKTNALVEVAGGAALIADPKDPKDIAKKLLMVIKDKKLAESLSQKGSERAKLFSWKKTVKEVVDFYKEVFHS